MELLGFIFYILVFTAFCGLLRNGMRTWQLSRENKRRSKESIAENGRLENRPVMRIERIKRT